MHTRKRLVSSLTLIAVIALTAACGGAAEEPVAEAPPAAEPAPITPEAAPVPEPVPEPVEPAAPAEPQLEGDIVEVGEGEFAWTTAASREVPGKYYWEVRLRNDTTQTLDITVTYEFTNAEGQLIKTDRSTVRISPAETGTFRVEDEMNRDDSRAVEFTTYSWSWEIVESS